MKRQIKRLFNWCPQPQALPNYRVLRQHSKPIIAVFAIGALAVSIVMISVFSSSNAIATVPLAIEDSLSQTPTATPETTPSSQPIQTNSPTPNETLNPSQIPTPTPVRSNSFQSTGTTTLSQGSNDDEVFCLVQSTDGCKAFAGCTMSYGAGGSDMYLVKTEQGPLSLPGLPTATIDWVLWNKTYGGSQDDGAKGIVLCSDGGYLLTGYTKSYGSGGSDMFLVKTDSNGNLQWNSTYGGSNDDAANCIAQASDGGFVIAGYTNSDVQSQSTWIVKVDTLGNMQWNTVCSGQSASSITRTSDDGYCLAVEQPNAYGLVKLNSTGQVQWSRTFSGPSYAAKAESLVQTADGGYAVTGWITSQIGANSTWLLKTDSTGTLQWSRTYLGLGAFCIIQTSGGGYAMTGDCNFLIITDSSGNIVWSQNYFGVSPNPQCFLRGYAVIQPAPNYYVIAYVQASYGMVPMDLQSYEVNTSVSK